MTRTHGLLLSLLCLVTALMLAGPLRAETYDAELAAKDEYGMKRYVMAMLMSGPNRDQTEEEAERLQRAHLDNITRLAEAGKLVLAGPFLEEGSLRGIYIFNVTSVEEAKALTESDPAIKAGRLVMELHPWYGSAALMEVNRLHDKLAKKAI
ncbi:YciI family protein [Shewanella sp. Isolate7]|uniref:YciI family protein n=1 Tax=Shewanella sp. Isolate7 TaxID=2908528 RepID=UPI001EFE3083|nr:YciI family protein [Shewanella sp. Isolate7]MCG9721714.1 YciI family protein [Shewanella sp. Isolate7]